MINFRTPYNHSEMGLDKGEVNNLPSETIPNQSMSVQEILSRWTRGLPIGGAKVPTYHGDDLLPDLKKLDFAEIEQLKKDVRASIDDVNQRLKNELANYNKLEQEQREKKLNERLKQLEEDFRAVKSIPPKGTTENNS